MILSGPIFRRRLAKAIAPVLALTTVIVLLILPALVFRLTFGVPLDAKGPKGEALLIVLGGGLGAGGARIICIYILASVGGLTPEEIDRYWHGY